MSSTDSTIIPVLSLVVAVLAVFVGPYISWKVAKRQIEASAKLAKLQMLGPMRQAWINELRGLIAEVSSSCLHYFVTGFDDRTDEEYKRIKDIEHKIQLMINPKEDDHKHLVERIQKMVSSLEQGSVADQDFIESYEIVMRVGKEVLKKEWNVVKET